MCAKVNAPFTGRQEPREHSEDTAGCLRGGPTTNVGIVNYKSNGQMAGKDDICPSVRGSGYFLVLPIVLDGQAPPRPFFSNAKVRELLEG